MKRTRSLVIVTGALLLGARPTAAQGRPTPPTRDPHSPGYVTATELPDGTLPSPDATGNFIISSATTCRAR